MDTAPRRDGRARFVEYRLGPVATGLRVLAEVFATLALTSVGAFFLGVLPLVGVVDEHALGYANARALDDWSRTWLGITAGAGYFGGGALAVVLLGAAGAAARARLRGEADRPGARDRVPVHSQRVWLTKDPWAPLHGASGWLGLLAGIFFVSIAIYALVMLAGSDDDLPSILLATAALGTLTAVCVVAWRLSRPRPSVGSKTAAVWSEKAAKEARGAARSARRGAQRAGPGALDRVAAFASGPGARAIGWAAAGWAVVGVVMVFIRKPGREAAPNHFSDPVEDGIQVVWRILVVVALVLAVLAALGWLALLGCDALRLAVLARRAQRGDTAGRPPGPTLSRLTQPPGAAGRAGRTLVALAALLGPACWAMRLSGRGPADLATTGLIDTAALAVLGAVLIGVGYGAEGRWRQTVRAAWPVPDAPVESATVDTRD